MHNVEVGSQTVWQCSYHDADHLCPSAQQSVTVAPSSRLQSVGFGEAFLELAPEHRLLWYRKLWRAANQQVRPDNLLPSLLGVCPACMHAGRCHAGITPPHRTASSSAGRMPKACAS